LIPVLFPSTLGVRPFDFGATLMKTVTILALALFLLGCGPQTSRQAKKSGTTKPAASKSSESKREAKPKPSLTVDAGSFAGIPEAISALTEAAKGRKNDELIRADRWLVMQGGAAIEPLANVLNDEQAHVAARIAASYVLRQLGPNAKPALKQAFGSETKLVRLNAIESLSLVHPTDPDTIQTLLDLTGTEDERVRREAILALARIGPPAKDKCAERLVAILNDENEEETIRDAAKRALKKVNPRRSLSD